VYAKSKQHERTPDRRGIGFDVGEQLRHHFVDSICERAGAKKGSFYYFFKSKSDLTVAALEAEWNKNKANMDALFSPTTPPLERFDRYFDYVHDRLAELQQECGSILGLPSVKHRE